MVLQFSKLFYFYWISARRFPELMQFWQDPKCRRRRTFLRKNLVFHWRKIPYFVFTYIYSLHDCIYIHIYIYIYIFTVEFIQFVSWLLIWLLITIFLSYLCTLNWIYSKFMSSHYFFKYTLVYITYISPFLGLDFINLLYIWLAYDNYLINPQFMVYWLY